MPDADEFSAAIRRATQSAPDRISSGLERIAIAEAVAGMHRKLGEVSVAALLARPGPSTRDSGKVRFGGGMSVFQPEPAPRAPATVILSPALAALLPQPLDRIIADLRALCDGDTPADGLSAALDDLVGELDEATVFRIVLPIVRERDETAWTPGEHLFALESHYAPPEEDRPAPCLDADEDDRECRDWDRLHDAACARAEREWRSDMARMLDALLKGAG